MERSLGRADRFGPELPENDELPAEPVAHGDAAPVAQAGDTLEAAAADAASAPFVGKWNRLVSRTNWEKGRIICLWREALERGQADPAETTDEAWSRRVGGVTPQHVGRLRRVWQRFGESSKQYDGLFWSHFQAALDWLDAEMWLEGAVQNGWSVAVMRRTRWESLGAPEAERPSDADIVSAELDEDFAASPPAAANTATTENFSEVRATDESAEDGTGGDAPFDFPGEQEPVDDFAPPAAAPFAALPPLPADLADAVESLKLAIIRHRQDGWREVSVESVLAALDAVRQLALAEK